MPKTKNICCASSKVNSLLKEFLLYTFPKKNYPWAYVENAIIKDDLITIDFKDNKLIQKQINEPVSITITTEFNAFCAEQIAQSRTSQS
jgi:hypothetical protein